MKPGWIKTALPVASALLLAASARAEKKFAPGELVWCQVHGSYVDAPHECNLDDSAGYCGECEGFFRQVATGEHIHLSASSTAPSASVAAETRGRDKNGGVPAGEDGSGDSVPKMPLNVLLAALGGIVAFFALVVIAAASKPLFAAAARRRRERRLLAKAREIKFKNGVPHGTALFNGCLVCAMTGNSDGGTAEGYFAKWRPSPDRPWTDAFVKRVVASSVRTADRFPLVQFESAVLQRMSGTGATPPLLVPATIEKLPSGETWMYYAMGVASGKPWPEKRGGLGRDTHLALAVLCKALVDLHANGIGHNDLKPQNIYWDSRSEKIVLLDVGSAIDHTGLLRNPLSGLDVGTLPWKPPATDGRKLGERALYSDNWVYGLLFCQAVVGRIKENSLKRRLNPENDGDRAQLKVLLARKTGSMNIANAVVDGLMDIRSNERMRLSDFLEILRRERWYE